MRVLKLDSEQGYSLLTTSAFLFKYSAYFRENVGVYSWPWEVVPKIARFARPIFMQFLHMGIGGIGMGYLK
jgi:hypothetical protein